MSKIAKAVVAALTVFGAEFHLATRADSLGGTPVTRDEWVTLIVSTVVAGVAVWAVPNTPPGPVE